MPLSQWLIQNEDSMYRYVETNLEFDDIDWKNTSSSTTEHVIEDAEFQVLQDKLNEKDSLIELYITCNRTKNTKQYTLLFSYDYIKSNSNYLDSVFTDIDTLKHFKILKYRNPENIFSEYMNEYDTLKADKIKFEIKKVNSKYDLNLITKRQIKESTKDQLVQSILGEEILLKQIGKVEYNTPAYYKLETKSIEELRTFFHIPNE